MCSSPWRSPEQRTAPNCATPTAHARPSPSFRTEGRWTAQLEMTRCRLSQKSTRFSTLYRNLDVKTLVDQFPLYFQIKKEMVFPHFPHMYYSRHICNVRHLFPLVGRALGLLTKGRAFEPHRERHPFPWRVVRKEIVYVVDDYN